jgi:2-polyprenyl-3-methyl-5-hydroxy-6-metoxy-1,4-benzoquinol methylase
MRLIIGPTSAGKSRYIEQMQEGSPDQPPVVHFAFELKDELPTGENDVVHYNLLHDFKGRNGQSLSMLDSGLPRLVEAAAEVVVLAAPRSVLMARSASRTKAEPGHEEHAGRKYHQDTWNRALGSKDLAQIYEHLALLLDESGTPHQYLCTNTDAHGGELQPIARWELPRMAAEDAEVRCHKGHTPPRAAEGKRSYQTDHRIGAVSATLSRALTMRLAGKKVLDIGCAEGAVALSAARMGARVTGIEPRARRLALARKAAEVTDADVDLRHMMLDDLGAKSGAFDVVLALNVAHHVPNPFAFLDRAADLTSSHLVLEYPGLDDEKFLSTLDSTEGLSDQQPLIGVSTRAQDQTFVFTPAGLERYFLDTVQTFEHHRVVASPMPNRWISVFSGKSKTATPAPNPALLQKRLEKRDRQVERLQQRIRDMEASRSWKVTAPLRKATDRIRPQR